MKNKQIFILITIMLCSCLFANANKLDSLKTLIHQAKTDTQQITFRIKYNEELLDVYPDTALQNFLQLEKQLRTALRNKKQNPVYLKHHEKQLQKVLNDIGYYYAISGNLDKSSEYFLSALQFAKKNKNYKRLAELYNNLGFVAKRKGDINLALDYYIKSLKIKEQHGMAENVPLSLSNIASIYFQQKEYEKAKQYFENSVAKIRELGSDKEKILAITLHNLGHTYTKLKNYEKAIQVLNESLTLKQKYGLNSYLPPTLLDLGDAYQNLNNYTKAESYFNQAYTIAEALNNKEYLARSLIHLASLYDFQGNTNKALIFAKKGKIYADQLQQPELIKEADRILYRIYLKKNNFKNALLTYTEYIKMRDSLFNQETRKNTLKKQFQFEYQRKRLADSLKVEKDKAYQKLLLDKKTAELEKEKTTKYALYIGVFMLLIILILIYYAYTKTIKANKLVNKQKAIVEQKNTEITDSINYAKRIQDAVINRNEVNNYLPEHFVIFLPKDIVSGDFYWSKAFEDNQGNVTLHIAAADCTGHGVPGAFMSLLGISYLNELVDYKTNNAAQVLNNLRQKIIDNVQNQQTTIKDGMDLSYCIISYNKNEPEKNYQIQYAGAFNPLYVISDKQLNLPHAKTFTTETSDYTLYEIKADRQSIGYVNHLKPFTNHTITLNQYDKIYLFTDGFADQFGGAKGKKLKYKPFKQLLLTVAHYSMAEQEKHLTDFFKKWRAHHEQTDDVTLIGIQLKS